MKYLPFIPIVWIFITPFLPIEKTGIDDVGFIFISSAVVQVLSGAILFLII